MSSLAVKHRPRKIEDIVGQAQAKKVMNSIISSKKMPAAILLSGSTGCGKTTQARILARTINCEKGKGCGKCDSCKIFDADPEGHPDYLEVNAASDSGIDKVRELIELAKYQPTFNHRFIVLDEAHGMSRQAANALLKPLEEPKPNTTWILATTDPQKLLKTISNRCLTVTVNPAGKEELASHLKRVAKKEKFKLSSKGANKIAEFSGGYVRDSLSVLESIIASGAKSKKLDAAIEEAFAANDEMGLGVSAAGLLIGIYESSNSTVVQALSDVKDFVNLTNKIIYMNGYLMYYIQKSVDKSINNPYFFSYETKILMDALADDLKDKKKKSSIFKRSLVVTQRVEEFRGRLLNTSTLDPRTTAISIFCEI